LGYERVGQCRVIIVEGWWLGVRWWSGVKEMVVLIMVRVVVSVGYIQ
jgi:hypothetical protein